MKTVRQIPIAVALALAVGTLGTPATAADSAQPSTITVVAQGLAAPRGLVYDPVARRVLVAEAGLGGPAQQQGGTCALTSEGALWCFGSTGAVFQYTERNGKSRRIAEGLPSIAAYDDTGANRLSVMGLHDLSLNQFGQLRAIFGLTGDPEFRAGLSPAAIGLGQLGRLRGDRARLALDADLAGFEQQHNPDDGPSTEANPFGMSASPFGTVVVDASGNDLLLALPNGSIRTLAIFPPRAPAADPSDVIETVPTTVTRGPDGAFYVGELTGFPFYKGEARVWRVVPGKAPTVFASGFTCIADLTFDERGRLVVLEMAKEGLTAPDRTGRLVRLEHNGSRTDLATTGLNRPGGVVYAGHGTYYVTNFTSSAIGAGQLLRINVRH